MTKICGIWKRTTADGRVFYSGNLSPTADVLLFPVDDGSKKPAFDLFIAERKRKGEIG